jgi:hypothetical protein
MPQVVAPIWERIARRHLLRAGRRAGLPAITEIGAWWSARAQTRTERSERVDVIGLDRQSRSVVFGEARWRQEPFTPADLEQLAGRGQAWLLGSDAHWDVHYAVFARNVAPGLLALAGQEPNVHLFTPADVVAG